MANFIEAVRKQIGDAVFFASEFGTWRTKFENGVETMITLFNNAGDTAKKRQALDTKKVRVTAIVGFAEWPPAGLAPLCP